MRHCKLAQRFAAFIVGLAAAAGVIAQPAVTITHVHGLAFSADGKKLMIPSHHGLALYENGRWSKAPGPQHDYMGFSATEKYLYSSGHPAAGSGLVNPFGVIRSRDGAKTWDKLGLGGETDFHLLATGWNTNAIYVGSWTDMLEVSALFLAFVLGLVWPRREAEWCNAGFRWASRRCGPLRMTDAGI
ncbi:MAG: hypothetical protein ACREUO_09520 [Burkholderiales bacterium]